MSRFSNKTLEAIKELMAGVDDCHSVRIVCAVDHQPKGKLQDCDTGHVKTEWVDQGGGGFTGDDFHGTVTWAMGGYYVIASY